MTFSLKQLKKLCDTEPSIFTDEQIKAVKEEFGAQPAAEKTITNKKETYGRSNTANIAYNPSDSKKAAQFDRLLKARKN